MPTLPQYLTTKANTVIALFKKTCKIITENLYKTVYASKLTL